MKRPRPSSGTVILTYCIFFVPLSNAFILTDRCPLRRAAPRYEVGRYFQTYLPDRCGLKMMSSASWESNDRADIIRGIMEWQERDEEIGAAGLRILTESSPSGVLARYYDSLADVNEQKMLLVAPSCAIEGSSALMVERALSSARSSRVYHPDAKTTERRGPHFALWHEAPVDTFSASSVLLQQTATLSEESVMEEIFQWLQRTLLGMVDSDEARFIDLGRKLLTVHKYVVVNATTEAELSRSFWAEATELAKRSSVAAERMAEKTEDEAPGHGVGGGADPREDSVLLAVPGFRFNDREGFKNFVQNKLAEPLKLLSPIGSEGVALFADGFAGEDLKFPVILLFPFLREYTVPEGGYKFINAQGEVQDAEEYIRRSEAKLAQGMVDKVQGDSLIASPSSMDTLPFSLPESPSGDDGNDDNDGDGLPSKES